MRTTNVKPHSRSMNLKGAEQMLKHEEGKAKKTDKQILETRSYDTEASDLGYETAKGKKGTGWMAYSKGEFKASIKRDSYGKNKLNVCQRCDRLIPKGKTSCPACNRLAKESHPMSASHPDYQWAPGKGD